MTEPDSEPCRAAPVEGSPPDAAASSALPNPDEPAADAASDIAGCPSAGRYQTPPAPIRLFRSEELFGGSRLVCIEHAGSTYRLQITARGKLILQK